MFGYIAENIGTIVVGAVVLVIVTLAAVTTIRRLRRGSDCGCDDCGCGCGCESCGHTAHREE
jgi:hypothetical protein